MKKLIRQRIEEIDNEIEALYNEHGYYAPFDPISINISKHIARIMEKVIE